MPDVGSVTELKALPGDLEGIASFHQWHSGYEISFPGRSIWPLF